jgi:hypothetical protein
MSLEPPVRSSVNRLSTQLRGTSCAVPRTAQQILLLGLEKNQIFRVDPNASKKDKKTGAVLDETRRFDRSVPRPPRPLGCFPCGVPF